MNSKITAMVAVACFALLSGCALRTEGYEMKIAIDICADHGGVGFLSHISNLVQCNDGFSESVAKAR